MKTFEQLKEQITPELIKKLCELAEGFACNDIDEVFYTDVLSCEFKDIYKFVMFPLLLHRAVEGFNKSDKIEVVYIKYDIVELWMDRIERFDFRFEDYQLCHLTPCEMAILDCLIEVLK